MRLIETFMRIMIGRIRNTCRRKCPSACGKVILTIYPSICSGAIDLPDLVFVVVVLVEHFLVFLRIAPMVLQV